MDKHRNSIKGEKQTVEWYVQYDAISVKIKHNLALNKKKKVNPSVN